MASDLTDEHIIPEAIHGALVIKNGSCVNCARHSNSAYENLALETDLKLPRFLLGLRGKGKGKPPKDIRHLPPVYADDVTLGQPKGARLDFPVEDYPKIFHLLAFPPPGLLEGIDRGGDLKGIQLRFYNLGSRGRSDVTIEETRRNGPFALMLAKIGYCYAMAERGADAFEHSEIRSLLCGQRNDYYNFVGVTSYPERLANRDLHGLYIRERGEWLAVLVDLFASCVTDRKHAKPYEVVVGRRR